MANGTYLKNGVYLPYISEKPWGEQVNNNFVILSEACESNENKIQQAIANKVDINSDTIQNINSDADITGSWQFHDTITGTITNAITANSATTATTASIANHADSADNANHATTADAATFATSADTASSALSADNADYAERANRDAQGNIIHDTYLKKSEQINITGDVANLINNIPSINSAITNNANAIQDLNNKYNKCVHTEGDQTIDGTKTFTSSIVGTLQGNATSADMFSSAKTIKLVGGVTGSASGTNSWQISTTVSSIDASKITSGTIDIARLPQGALERLVTVSDQNARFALTTASVQAGDIVKQNDTGKMYIVVNDTKLNNANGYMEFTAGTATSVPWSGITSKPTDYPPSAHTHGNITNNGELGTASRVAITDSNKKITVSSITSAELDCLDGVTGSIQTQINDKADTNHSHTISDISNFPVLATVATTGNYNDLSNAPSIDDFVKVEGDQTVNDVKTFTQTVEANISGNSHTCDEYFINLVTNAEEFAQATTIVPPTLADVFQSWYRFSHYKNIEQNTPVQYNNTDRLPDTSTSAGNASKRDMDAWSYDPITNSISNSRNTTTYIGFISDKKYDTYHIKTKVGSETNNDDDMITIIVAFMTDSNGVEHTLSLVRKGDYQSSTNFPEFKVVFGLVYDAGLPTCVPLVNKTSMITYQVGWKERYAYLDIERDKQTIICKTSQINEDDLTVEFTYSLPKKKGSLTDEAFANITYMLTHKTPMGFGLWSQIGYFYLDTMDGILDSSDIYNTLNDRIYTYDYNTETYVQTTRKVSDELPENARIYSKISDKTFIMHDGIAYSETNYDDLYRDLVTVSTPQTIIGTKTLTNTVTTHDIVPEINNAYDLGSASNLWKNIYSNGVYIGTHEGVVSKLCGTRASNGTWSFNVVTGMIVTIKFKVDYNGRLAVQRIHSGLTTHSDSDIHVLDSLNLTIDDIPVSSGGSTDYFIYNGYLTFISRKEICKFTINSYFTSNDTSYNPGTVVNSYSFEIGFKAYQNLPFTYI